MYNLTRLIITVIAALAIWGTAVAAKKVYHAAHSHGTYEHSHRHGETTHTHHNH